MTNAVFRYGITALALLVFISSDANAARLSGTIKKNKLNHTLTFDLRLETWGQTAYAVEGITLSDAGWLNTDLDFSFVRVRKLRATAMIERGGTREKDTLYEQKHFPNSTIVRYNFRGWRTILPDSRMVGMPISGYFDAGILDKGFWLNGLAINNQPTLGSLQYNLITGSYSFTKRPEELVFGGVRMRGLDPAIVGKKNILNYDEDLLHRTGFLHMNFIWGDFLVEGKVGYAPLKAIPLGNPTVPADPSDPNGRTASRRDVGTQATFQAYMSNVDGSDIRLSQDLEKDNEGDKAVQTFLTFLQLIAYDLVDFY